MRPACPLPLSDEFEDADNYVNTLLEFAGSNELFMTLCGGVHILDFLTREPDLYTTVLPEDWPVWFKPRPIDDILDLLLKEDLDQFRGQDNEWVEKEWRQGVGPPATLLEYIHLIRTLSLRRDFSSPSEKSTRPTLTRTLAVGMKVKKMHEVQNFAYYVSNLSSYVSERRGQGVTHLVDFGSGQNYLGRVLASKPYYKHIVAVESKQLNIEGARDMDILAKLVKKEKIIRNKRLFRSEDDSDGEIRSSSREDGSPYIETPSSSAENSSCGRCATSETIPIAVEMMEGGKGSVQYVEHEIKDGNLDPVLAQVIDSQSIAQSNKPEAVEDSKRNLMVISLHSCGNLVHHGIRSLLLNPSVSAVAMIGCCYNLVTERLGPPTYKLPILRPNHPRLEETGNAYDPHGFPMSKRLEDYPHPRGGVGLKLNITARMMAVQAVQNWTAEDSEGFFKRHFFRAVLQRIFLDRGVVSKPTKADDVVGGFVGGRSPAGFSGGTSPIIIGSLRKACYVSFVAYVRGALAKLVQDPVRGALFEEKMSGMTDEEISAYEIKYSEQKKQLATIWTFMAFSASVVEAIIVVDRWLFLTEQKDMVREAWVEPVFDYKLSPRNLAVIGIKR